MSAMPNHTFEDTVVQELEDLGLAERIILKWILKKQSTMV
jgi:hypothetical protein